MANCKTCQKSFPFFTIRDIKRPNPTGDGYLCKTCFEPYGLVMETYTTNLEKCDADPKAAAWVALCYLLTAQRINLVRTVTSVICGINEKKNSWEVCRQRAIELATKATSMLPPGSEGEIFLKAILTGVEKVTESPQREIPIQRHASVWGDSIKDIGYEALIRSGLSIDELNNLIASMPGNRWLSSPQLSINKKAKG